MGFAIFFLVLSGLLVLFIGFMFYALFAHGDDRTKPAIPFAIVLLAVTCFFGISLLVYNINFKNNVEKIFDNAVDSIKQEEFGLDFKVTKAEYEIDDADLNGLMKNHNCTVDVTWHFTVDLNSVSLENVQKALYNYVEDLYPSEIKISKSKSANVLAAISEISIYVNGEKYVKKPYESSFTNDYGSPDTTCMKSGCTKKIASSGDTAYCASHSGRCGNCRCYVDPDAMFCMDCLRDALE